jgi:hypothetical protein
MSQHHARANWSTEQPKIRARILPQLPLPCGKCGRLVHAEQPWHVGHNVDLSAGGTSADGFQPEHARCSTSSGGRLGAAVTHGKRAAPKVTSARPTPSTNEDPRYLPW